MTYEDNSDELYDTYETEDTESDVSYDYYLFSEPGALEAVVSKVVVILDCVEAKANPRQRRRKASDQRSLLHSIESVVSNLAHVFLTWGPRKPVVVSRRKDQSSSNTNKELPHKTFIRCLDLLEKAGLVSAVLGVHNGPGSTIKAGTALEAMFVSHGVDFKCFRRCSTRPLVTLRRSFKPVRGRKPWPVPVCFKPTEDTDRMVAQVERLNAFFSGADIEFVSDGLHPCVDPHARTMVRCFNLRGDQSIRFDQGGRLFGRTFWLGLRSSRRQHIRIDGEPVADLDFKNLGPRLAYAMLGQEAPEGDLYDLTGLLPGYDHHNEAYRKAIKQAFASCLNGGRGGQRGVNPKTGKPGILEPLPKGTTAEKVRKALLMKHPCLSEFFEPTHVPVGFSIMFDESRILLCALEKLMAAGVVALPFHDGVIVAASKRGIAQEALQAASEEIMGERLPVELKRLYKLPRATEGLLAA